MTRYDAAWIKAGDAHSSCGFGLSPARMGPASLSDHLDMTHKGAGQP